MSQMSPNFSRRGSQAAHLTCIKLIKITIHTYKIVPMKNKILKKKGICMHIYILYVNTHITRLVSNASKVLIAGCFSAALLLVPNLWAERIAWRPSFVQTPKSHPLSIIFFPFSNTKNSNKYLLTLFAYLQICFTGNAQIWINYLI